MKENSQFKVGKNGEYVQYNFGVWRLYSDKNFIRYLDIREIEFIVGAFEFAQKNS